MKDGQGPRAKLFGDVSVARLWMTEEFYKTLLQDSGVLVRFPFLSKIQTTYFQGKSRVAVQFTVPRTQKDLIVQFLGESLQVERLEREADY